MALGFIKKVFSFGKDKAETNERPQEDAALVRGNENASFEAALSEAEAHVPVDEDPVSELEMETAGGPVPDEAADATPSEEEDDEEAPLLPGAELSGDMGLVAAVAAAGGSRRRRAGRAFAGSCRCRARC